jgi:hypothetical protein
MSLGKGGQGSAGNLQEQHEIEHKDDGGCRRRCGRGEAPVRIRTHDIAAPRQDQRGDHGGRQKEAGHDLAENERPGGVESDGHDRERVCHRDEPPKPERNAEPDEALHDDLPGHRADRRARQSGSNQRHQEHPRGAGTKDRYRGTVGATDRCHIICTPSWKTEAAIVTIAS